jgi:hypothetical protein
LPTSSSPDARLRELAETPDRFTRIGDNVERFADERVCILQSAAWASVSGIRVEAGEVEALVAEVRERVPAETWTTWWIGPSSQPPDLERRLRTLGLGEPADRVSSVRALACAEPPASGPSDVRVRRVETLDDFRAAMELSWEVFATPPERRAREHERLAESFAAQMRAESPVTFVAELDGRLAGMGRSIPSDRGVFEWARGRGVYRALVRARWDDAVARGTPGLVTEAIADTSYPILKRLGFVDVCEIRRLEDRRG